MGLTIAGGPLSRRLPDTRNFHVAGPAHSLLLEPFGRRVRAEVDGVVVLDTERGRLLHETGLLPQLYAPEEDFDRGLLEPSDTTTHCPFKGDATYRSLRVGERVVPDAVWAYPEPLEGASWLAGLAALPMGSADRWFDEDDEVAGHLTDPYHRLDLRHSRRRVRVTLDDGTPVAEAESPVLLCETGLDPRWYVSRWTLADGVHLERTDTVTVCPYKGTATWFTVHVGGRTLTDAAWCYETPHDEAAAIMGRVCLLHDDLRTEVARG